MSQASLRVVPLAFLLMLSACRTGLNYTEPVGPRYAGAGVVEPPDGSDTLTILSFNIAFAVRVDSAIAVLTSDPLLRDADVVLLQEMDEPGTRAVAAALGLDYVYYPAIRSTRTDRDFGNAVLSRWPIVDDEKLILPYYAAIGRTQRTATAATIRVGETPIRVYSTHLATMIGGGPSVRREQLQTILDDARGYPLVILGGDLNSHGVGDLAVEHGFDWPTEHGPRTVTFGRWDHIFFKGLASPESGGAGTVLDNRDASDHRPVWARAILPAERP